MIYKSNGTQCFYVISLYNYYIYNIELRAHQPNQAYSIFIVCFSFSAFDHSVCYASQQTEHKWQCEEKKHKLMNCTTLQTESESVAVKESVRERKSEQQNQTWDGYECIRNTFVKEKIECCNAKVFLICHICSQFARDNCRLKFCFVFVGFFFLFF